MKKRVSYICEYCKTEYETEEAALNCEEHHLRPVRIVDPFYSASHSSCDSTSRFPLFIHVQFEGGGQQRYRRD